MIHHVSVGTNDRLIEKIVGSYFGGTGQLAYQPTGVHFRLSGTLDSGRVP